MSFGNITQVEVELRKIMKRLEDLREMEKKQRIERIYFNYNIDVIWKSE